MRGQALPAGTVCKDNVFDRHAQAVNLRPRQSEHTLLTENAIRHGCAIGNGQLTYPINCLSKRVKSFNAQKHRADLTLPAVYHTHLQKDRAALSLHAAGIPNSATFSTSASLAYV